MDYIVVAITLGSTYALIALGYALIYCCLRLINFAHGEFCTVGAYVTWWVATRSGVGAWTAVGLGILAGGLIAVLTWSLAYRPIRYASRPTGILAALGVSIVLQQALARVFGAQSRAFPQVLGAGSLISGRIHLDTLSLVTLLGTGAILVSVHILWAHTRLGLMVRAVADDRDAAECLGISADRVTMVVFFAAGLAAGFAGLVLASSFARVEPTMGFAPALKAFVAALVGGLRDPRGAALGGLCLGAAETVAVAVGLSAYRDAAVLLLLVVALVVRARAEGRVLVLPPLLPSRD